MFMALNIESLYAIYQALHLSIERATGFRSDILLMLGAHLLISGPTALFFLFDKQAPHGFALCQGSPLEQ